MAKGQKRQGSKGSNRSKRANSPIWVKDPKKGNGPKGTERVKILKDNGPKVSRDKGVKKPNAKRAKRPKSPKGPRA